MRGYKDISWKTAKGMMAEGNFLKTLQVEDANPSLSSASDCRDATYFLSQSIAELKGLMVGDDSRKTRRKTFET
jgi:dynein heavy chain